MQPRKQGQPHKGWKASAKEIRRQKPMLCDGCLDNYADPPSDLCPGCQAYREHQQ